MLNLIFHVYAKRLEDCNGFREMWAQEVWKKMQILERLSKKVPHEILEDIEIQAEVLEMDPEFSFYNAVFGEEPKPFPTLSELKPLNVHSQEHSSAR